MKSSSFLLLSALTMAIFSGCGNEIDRWPTYSYHLWNGMSTDIRIVGTCSKCSETRSNDTLIDTIILPGSSFFLISGLELIPPPFDAPMFKSNGIEDCDSIYILNSGQEMIRFGNPYYTPAAGSALIDKIYEFDNPQTYVPFDTVMYESDGPQPKEIRFRFMID